MTHILMSSTLIVGTSGAPVLAGSWNVSGQGQVGGNHDDNIRLTAANPVEAWSGVADVSGQLVYQDDTLMWRLNPRLIAVRYDSEQSYNRDEQYVTLLGQHRSEKRSSSITLSATADTTLTSELGLTGLAEVNKKHRSGAATLASQWNMTELLSVNAQLYATVNRYVDAGQTGLVDYNYGSAVLGTGYQWTEQSSVTLQASVGTLQVPELPRLDKTNVSVSLGYEVDWSPRWRSSVSVGPSQIRTQDGTQSGSVYAVSLTRAAERSSLALSVLRDVTPNGLGSLGRREQAQLGWNAQLTERWTMNWSATAARNQNVLASGRLEQARVDYGDVTGSVTWNITPTWRTSLSAGHSLQRLDRDQVTAKRNHAALNISWNGLMRTLN